MNKIILSLSLILAMLLISFLKGYGEEESQRAEYKAQTYIASESQSKIQI